MVTTLARGQGDPVTVFAHGLGGTITDTRPLGSGVAGTKVFYTARAHDGVAVDRVDYAGMAADLDAVAARHGASQALGVSMGAGALCRLLSQSPDRFDRVVFLLPAVLDTPRPPPETMTRQLWRSADQGDTATVAGLLKARLPAEAHGTSAGDAFVASQADTLAQPSMRGVSAALASQVAVPDAAELAEVTASGLVLAAHDDSLHPVAVAERLARALPNATLHIYDTPHVMWRHRADLRQRVAAFLSPATNTAMGSQSLSCDD